MTIQPEDNTKKDEDFIKAMFWPLMFWAVVIVAIFYNAFIGDEGIMYPSDRSTAVVFWLLISFMFGILGFLLFGHSKVKYPDVKSEELPPSIQNWFILVYLGVLGSGLSMLYALLFEDFSN